MANSRNYERELSDTSNHKYAYNFDLDVMHKFMIKAFQPFFQAGNVLELGSFKGHFTKRLQPLFHDITCVEASEGAIKEAQKTLDGHIKFIHGEFNKVALPKKYDNIILTHVLEHIDDPVNLLSLVRNEWLSNEGRLFIACPNANAISRQIAVAMGLITHNAAVTEAEKAHGHRITYCLETLKADARLAELNIIHSSGIFIKALANFQWDRLLETDIINEPYLEGCFSVGQKYPDLCSSIYLVCNKGQV